MDDPASISTYLSLAVFLALSFLFSGSESAFLRLGELTIRRLQTANDARAKRVVNLSNSMPSVIAALLLGNTAVNICFATGVTTLMIGGSKNANAEVWSTIVSTLMLLFFGEISPKTLVTANPVGPALSLSGFVSVVTFALKPVTRVLDAAALWLLNLAGWKAAHESSLVVTAETLEVAADLGKEQGVFDEAEHQMIRGALDTGDTPVRAIMTPRPDVTRLPVNATVQEALDLIIQTGFSRLPVFDGSIDDIVGIVAVRDLLPFIARAAYNEPISTVLTPPAFVSETVSVSEFLRQAKARGYHLAVVLDEFGGTAGVVTVEDAIEEIVGNIDDEFDRQSFEGERVDGGYLLSARLPIDEANQLFGLDLALPDDVDTIGGLVYDVVGEVPRLGQTVTVNDWAFTVDELKGSRILRVRVHQLSALPHSGEVAN